MVHRKSRWNGNELPYFRLRKISWWICESPRRFASFAQTFGAIQHSCSISWERRWLNSIEKRIHYFPFRRIFRQFVLLACDFVQQHSKPLIHLDLILYILYYIWQIIQIKLLCKLSLYSSGSLARPSNKFVC